MKIGGNSRFNSLMAEYAITFESSSKKEFKHLLQLELNKEKDMVTYQDFL